jgi:hypothetical protein
MRAVLLLKEGQHPIIEHIRSDQGILPIIELGQGHLGIGVNESPLVKADTFDGAHVISALSTR